MPKHAVRIVISYEALKAMLFNAANMSPNSNSLVSETLSCQIASVTANENNETISIKFCGTNNIVSETCEIPVLLFDTTFGFLA